MKLFHKYILRFDIFLIFYLSLMALKDCSLQSGRKKECLVQRTKYALEITRWSHQTRTAVYMSSYSFDLLSRSYKSPEPWLTWRPTSSVWISFWTMLWKQTLNERLRFMRPSYFSAKSTSDLDWKTLATCAEMGSHFSFSQFPWICKVLCISGVWKMW